MSDQTPTRPAISAETVTSAVIVALLLSGLIATERFGSYLLFHTLAEMFSIVVGFAIFLVAWNTRGRPVNGYLRFFGIGCLFVAAIDLCHAMAYKGMTVFPAVTTANEATQFWIVGTSTRAVMLLIAPWFVGRRVPVKGTVAVLLGVSVLALLSILYWHNFPACFTDKGLTPFKIYCEYAICLVLAAAAVLWWRVRDAFPTYVRNLIIAALACSIISEVFFSLYLTPDGPRNLMGHLAKTLAFYFFYRAIVQTALRDPFDLLLHDLSQRETDLQHSERRYRTLVEMSPRGIAVQVGGKCTFANQAFADMLGAQSRDSVVGIDAIQMVAPTDREIVEERNRRLTEIGQVSAVCEVGLHRLDGQSITVESIASLIHWQGKLGIQMIIQDITARKQVETELQQAKLAAERASKAKDQFLAVLSHELRTPLTPVLASVSDLMHREAVPPEELRGTLQMIQRNVELQTRLVDDLLDLTRIERGKFRIERRPADVHDLIRHAIVCCRGEIDRKCIVLSEQLGAAETWADADPDRIEQVVWNLLINAVKFTSSGGRIEISTSNAMREGKSLLRIVVRDTGVGFGPDVKERIFVAFEQADESIHKRFGGLGLGLAISRAMVLLHGGQIEADSEGEGKGARFTVTLPVCLRPAGSPAETKPAPASRDVAPCRILLVEDHADSARIMARLLQSDGHAVRTAGDVAGAVNALGQFSFDLIISDIGLPDGSGIDLLKKVQQDRPGMRSICMSGFGAEQHVRASADVGAICHLVKPVSIQKLREAIRQASAADARP